MVQKGNSRIERPEPRITRRPLQETLELLVRHPAKPPVLRARSKVTEARFSLDKRQNDQGRFYGLQTLARIPTRFLANAKTLNYPGEQIRAGRGSSRRRAVHPTVSSATRGSFHGRVNAVHIVVVVQRVEKIRDLLLLGIGQ